MTEKQSLIGTVVVTGAASGIGRAAALRLREDGMRVIAVDMNRASLEELEGVEILVADLTNAEDRDRVVSAGTGARALVNAAGLIRLKPLLDFTVQDIRDIYAVNVEAPWDLVSRIGRTMPSGSSIVNLSSVSAKLTSTQETAVYASSKSAILSMTRSFAYAFGPKNVRVNAICPGIVDTPMQDKVLERLAEIRGISVEEISTKRLASVPLGRTSSPSEIAGLISFLISDEGSYFTGQALSQDGGITM
jgi:NAD(P)-dependent dehydrogenase (short-subunit alcohol dehydrogenase family)